MTRFGTSCTCLGELTLTYRFEKGLFREGEWYGPASCTQTMAWQCRKTRVLREG